MKLLLFLFFVSLRSPNLPHSRIVLIEKKNVHLQTQTKYAYGSISMYIIILAKGQFPTNRLPLTLLSEADSVVCCDGAFKNYFYWWRKGECGKARQVAVVGDGDSLDTAVLDEARQAGLDVIRKVVSEQESNDLSKALHYAVGQAQWKPGVNLSVDILGATGLREDHTIGNISLLAYYAQEFPDIEFRMVSDYGIFHPVLGRRCFDSHRGEQVSIFSLTPGIPVSVTGLRYPIENRCLNWLWEGTLNESLGDRFEVSGGTLVIYQEIQEK